MWYIWKARNDHHFHMKTWTPTQIHNAVVAHISSNNAAIAPQVVILENRIEASTSATNSNTNLYPLNQLPTTQQRMVLTFTTAITKLTTPINTW
jgi:hypothetical protein